jgi:hypothetical protein
VRISVVITKDLKAYYNHEISIKKDRWTSGIYYFNFPIRSSAVCLSQFTLYRRWRYIFLKQTCYIGFCTAKVQVNFDTANYFAVFFFCSNRSQPPANAYNQQKTPVNACNRSQPPANSSPSFFLLYLCRHNFIFKNFNHKTMNSTKTAVIIGIITLVVLGVLLYANRDKFSSNTAAPSTTTEEV